MTLTVAIDRVLENDVEAFEVSSVAIDVLVSVIPNASESYSWVVSSSLSSRSDLEINVVPHLRLLKKRVNV